MTQSVCTNCTFEMEGTYKFCPECGETFSGESTTTRVVETRDGPMMVVDKKMLTEAKNTETRGTPEHAAKAIRTKGSGAYMPTDAVLYQTPDKRILSHTEIRFAKEDKAEPPLKQEQGYRPKSSVIVADKHDNIIREEHSIGKEITATTESTKNVGEKIKTKYAELKDMIIDKDGVKEVIKPKPIAKFKVYLKAQEAK